MQDLNIKRRTLHTSEIYPSKKNLEKALNLLSASPDLSRFENTLIPADTIVAAITLLDTAREDLIAKLSTE